MDLRIGNGVTRVILSERNLRTLLAKINEPSSLRTLCRHTDQGSLMVTAEPDDVHYASREAGPVHPREEAKLREQRVSEAA